MLDKVTPALVRHPGDGDIKDPGGAEEPPHAPSAVPALRALATAGLLAMTSNSMTPNEKRRLRSAAYIIAAPVVFHRMTRVLEQRRGHRTCALGLEHLAENCLDRFHDDLEAVVEDLLANVTVPIHNIEGWIAARLQAVTVDAHRRRRGARGALQRPRLPAWLSQGLRGDPWLEQLAIHILEWVGVPDTAGTSLWPLDGWTERRAEVTGDPQGSDPLTLQHEIDSVLCAMRVRPQWYEKYVERPLSAKTPPVAPAFIDRDLSMREPSPLVLVEQHEIHEIRLAYLASIALDAIKSELAAGKATHATVSSVIKTVFGELDVAGDIHEVPHAGSTAGEQVMALISDPAQLRRITETVVCILADDGTTEIGPLAGD